MNYKPIVLFLAGAILCSCNKPLPDYSGVPFDYTVPDITGDTIPANDLFIFSSAINLVSGNAADNPITITFKGLPPNITVTKNDFSFRLNYTLSDSFIAHNAVQGVYPMQAIFSNKSTGTKAYNFNLVVAAPTNRVAKLVGGYYPSNSCLNNIYVSCEIDSVPGSPGKIMIIDRTGTNTLTYGTFDTSYGMVDCCTNTFVIPSQTIHGYTVSGNGSFNGPIIMNRTFVTDTATYPCTVTLSH